MKNLVVVGMLAVSLCACQRGGTKTPAADTTEADEAEGATGWLDADAPGQTTIVYKDAADSPGFSMSCVQATRSFRVSAPNPVEGAPIDKETATLILGDEAFLVSVKPGAAGATPSLFVEAPAIPKLLRAVADSKSARLVFRDGFVETGVDTEGRFLAFSSRCETLTGVTAGP